MVADAIAAYESSPEVSPFTSKYDYYLKGQAALTTREASGLALFSSPMKGNCSACHSLETKPGTPGPLLTDFSYDNLGIPKNMAIPAYQHDPTLQDLGLGAIVGDPAENGKFKVPTLRNVAVTGPWGHNGFFTSLEDIIQFYNARDVTPEVWGMPEVPETMNTTELGDLGLAPEEVADIGYFLNTLTDGYVPVPEPCTMALFATSVLVLGWWCHRRPRKANAARARPASAALASELPRTRSS